MNQTLEKVLLSLGLLGSVATAIGLFVLVPQFAEVFKSFGNDVPLPTYLLVHYYPVFCALPLLVLAAWFYWPKRKWRGVASCVIGLGSLVLGLPAFVFIMYLPVFKLAETSGL